MLPRETPLNPAIEVPANQIVDAAFRVHSTLGAGLLESIYEQCLVIELTKRGIKVARQVPLPISYDGHQITADFRLDLLVEDQIIVEIKSVETLLPVHKAQLLTYLKLSKLNLGFLINFNVPLIKQGINRIILSNFAPSRLRDRSSVF
ncbi:MAG: GxxExxY protein [Verrucomicrobiales bacterium]|jgi:GxxExxY protein|nr:GxxExxY protein [Verrucomicrobiales bacterium]